MCRNGTGRLADEKEKEKYTIKQNKGFSNKTGVSKLTLPDNTEKRHYEKDDKAAGCTYVCDGYHSRL